MAPQIEAHLEKCPSGWLANGPNPTSADYMMSYCMEAIASRAGGSPAIAAYVNRTQERPAYKRVSRNKQKIDASE